MDQSDYRRRGYTSLHIKTETRQRLNLAKAQMAARDGGFVTQDDLLNMLMDYYAATEPESASRVLEVA